MSKLLLSRVILLACCILSTAHLENMIPEFFSLAVLVET